MACGGLAGAVPADRTEEIRKTFRRIHRPLQWPMEHFLRKRVANRSFVGYRFSRVKGRAVAGFSFGFAMKPDALPGVTRPPEVVAYAFVEPVGSALYRTLVTRAGSPIRRLVSKGRGHGYPFEFHPGDPIAAIRHRSLAPLPSEIFVLAASDFCMISMEPMRAANLLEEFRKATTRPGS